jgi:hypothetical protein
MNRPIVPADATIAELERGALDCEKRAEHAQEPEATRLREEAKQYRDWIARLRSGLWKA